MNIVLSNYHITFWFEIRFFDKCASMIVQLISWQWNFKNWKKSKIIINEFIMYMNNVQSVECINIYYLNGKKENESPILIEFIYWTVKLTNIVFQIACSLQSAFKSRSEMGKNKFRFVMLMLNNLKCFHELS